MRRWECQGEADRCQVLQIFIHSFNSSAFPSCTTIRFILSLEDTVANVICAEAQFRLTQHRNKKILSGSPPEQHVWCLQYADILYFHNPFTVHLMLGSLLPEIHPSHTKSDIFAELLLDKRMQLRRLPCHLFTLFRQQLEHKKIHSSFHTPAQSFNAERQADEFFIFKLFIVLPK